MGKALLPRRRFLQLSAYAALPAVSRTARAQAYPTRPVRMMLGLSPGGSVDIVTRLIGQWLSERLGQQFVVDNRPGASGDIATEAVVRAPADGYTLLIVLAANAINWTLATYHPIQGIWQLGRAPPLGGGSPAMYWYGFVITAALGALAVTAITALVPDKLMDRMPWRSLTWLAPLCAIVYIGYVLLPYATKT